VAICLALSNQTFFHMDTKLFNFLTEQQVESILRQILREELDSIFGKNSILNKPKKLENQVVDLSGLLAARPFLGNRSTLYKKIAQGLIPHSKQGKKLFFDLKEIDKWLLENKVKSISELRKETRGRRGKKNRR